MGIVSNPDHHVEWKYKGLSNETIKVSYTDSNFLGPLLNYLGNKIKVKYSRSCLKQEKLHIIMEN